MTVIDKPTVDLLQRALEVHPRVAIRPEPFGALAYHYDTRRLVFLKHIDLVRVVNALAAHACVVDAFLACEIDPSLWSAFELALNSMIESEMLHDRLS